MDRAYTYACSDLKKRKVSVNHEDTFRFEMPSDSSDYRLYRRHRLVGRLSGEGAKQSDAFYYVEVSLEDLYKGVTKEISLSGRVSCTTCKGKGSICGSSGIFSCKCSDTVVSVPSGPTGIKQLQLFCLECEHSGEISAMIECPQCKGNKVIEEKKAFKFHIKKGMWHGDEIVFPGQADEAPDTVTGDVIFVVQEEEHPIFKRKLTNLYVEYKVELAETRCGFQRFLTHLDGRQILIKSDLSEIIKNGHEKIIYNEGMPHEGSQIRKGLLIVRFNVELPNSGAGCGEASSTSNCAHLNLSLE